MLSLLGAAALLLLLSAPAAHAHFQVELNAMRIREPSALEGEFDVAMGDVRLLLLSCALKCTSAA